MLVNDESSDDEEQRRMLTIKQNLARNKLHNIFRLVDCILKVYKAAVSSSQLMKQKKSKEREQTKTYQKLFDPTAYKFKGNMVDVTKCVKDALCTQVEKRTVAQLNTITKFLRSIKQFSEFPLYMLKRISTRVWYERFPPHRVIIRQGQIAENYYIILEGTIELSILKIDSNYRCGPSIRLKTFQKGDAFGERTLIEFMKRKGTCTSLSDVELLVLSRAAYSELFLEALEGKPEPDYISFLRRVPCMVSFPIDELVGDTEECTFFFYRLGMVVCADINKSDYVYIIKTGSCQVLAVLHDVVLEPSDDYPTLETLAHGFVNNAVNRPDTAMSRYRYLQINSHREQIEVCEPIDSTRYIDYTQTPHVDLEENPEEENVDDIISLSTIDSDSIDGNYRAENFKENVFVEVETLGPYDDFGIGCLHLDPRLDPPTKPPKLALVSCGCEIILIRREAIKRLADIECGRFMTEHAHRYHSEKELKQSYDNAQKWKHFKNFVTVDCLASKYRRKQTNMFR